MGLATALVILLHLRTGATAAALPGFQVAGAGVMPWCVNSYSYNPISRTTAITANEQTIQSFISALNRAHIDFTLQDHAVLHGLTRLLIATRGTSYLPGFDRKGNPKCYYEMMFRQKVCESVRKAKGKVSVTVLVIDTDGRSLSRLRKGGLQIATVDPEHRLVRGTTTSAHLRRIARQREVAAVEARGYQVGVVG